MEGAHSEQTQRLSLIVPFYNEERTLRSFLANLDKVEFQIEKELILVNDCSQDKSSEIIKSFEFKSKVSLIEHPKNLGKGAAIRSGIQASSGTIIGIQDADFEYKFGDIKKLIGPIINNEADVVYGNRFSKSIPNIHPQPHCFANHILTFLSNLCSGLELSDMETCYKFFRSEIIQNINLETNRFGFEPEVTAKLARLNLRLLEIPIQYDPRNYEEGKKITWQDGFAALWHVFYFNLLTNHNESNREVPKKFRKPV